MFFIYYYVTLSDFLERLEARRQMINTTETSSDPAAPSRVESVHHLNHVLEQHRRQQELNRALFHLSRPWMF